MSPRPSWPGSGRSPSSRSTSPEPLRTLRPRASSESGPDADSGVGFREFVDYDVEAESLGFVSTFMVEHHFTGFGQISATLSLPTFIAARTKTLRLSTVNRVVSPENPSATIVGLRF